MILAQETLRERARDAAFDFLFWLEHRRKRKAATFTPRSAHRPVSDNTTRLLVWLKEQPEPQTVAQIATALSLSAKTVQAIVARCTDKIEQAGTLARVGKAPPVKLWRIREGVKTMG